MSDLFPSNTAIVVGFTDEESQIAMDTLTQNGFCVVGPVDRAAAALALAAHAPIDLAVIGPDLRGRRGGPELAEALLTTWGAPSVVVADVKAPEDDWRAEGALAARIQALMANAEDPPAGA